jgi:hypothetical protein
MPGRRIILVALLCAALPFAAGCKKKNVQAAPPADTLPAVTAPPTAETKAAQPVVKTDSKTEPAPTPSLIVPPPKSAPAKSKTTPSPGTQPPAAALPTPPETEPPPPRGAPPQISPRLSPTEQVEYERKTMADIATSEKNLGRVGNRELNVAQRDMAEKIRGFLAQAREAMRANDWVRARTLAQKARLLSIELVNSL